MTSEVKIFSPGAPEVRKFRSIIYAEDLQLSPTWLTTYSSKNPPTSNKFAYWYSDEKFLTNNFDQVLLYYHDGEPVGMCCGTHFNKNLYRAAQMYYILKRARRIKGIKSLHFREGGFFDNQIPRARELGCKAIFISVDIFDKRHEIMYNAMKADVTGYGATGRPSSLSPDDLQTTIERKYTARTLTFLDNTYEIMWTQQKVCFLKLDDSPMTFDEMFYS